MRERSFDTCSGSLAVFDRATVNSASLETGRLQRPGRSVIKKKKTERKRTGRKLSANRERIGWDSFVIRDEPAEILREEEINRRVLII